MEKSINHSPLTSTPFSDHFYKFMFLKVHRCREGKVPVCTAMDVEMMERSIFHPPPTLLSSPAIFGKLQVLRQRYKVVLIDQSLNETEQDRISVSLSLMEAILRV